MVLFHNVLQARKNIVSILSQLIKERRASNEIHKDMLGFLMEREENKYKLSDEEIIDQVITLMYSGYETVSTTSMMAVKYLHDHPKALEELRVSAKLHYFLEHNFFLEYNIIVLNKGLQLRFDT
jgi:brassinosteroid-6-oxidase 1